MLVLGWCKASRGRAFAHNIDSTGEGMNCPSTAYAHSTHRENDHQIRHKRFPVLFYQRTYLRYIDGLAGRRSPWRRRKMGSLEDGVCGDTVQLVCGFSGHNDGLLQLCHGVPSLVHEYTYSSCNWIVEINFVKFMIFAARAYSFVGDKTVSAMTRAEASYDEY